MLSRREFLGVITASVAGATASRLMGAQEPQATAPTMAGPMDESAYRPVKLPPRGSPVLSEAERDDVERRLGCQCGCGLDIFICRTTHFTCEVSPAMHRDVQELIRGGHGAQEIIDAFQSVYGERVLMAPKKSGFNWAGYLVPYAALGGGAAAVIALIRRWHRPAPGPVQVQPLPFEATPDEMARLRAAMKDDSR